MINVNVCFDFVSLQKRSLVRLKRPSWMPTWRTFWSELRTPNNGQKRLWSRQKSYYSPTRVSSHILTERTDSRLPDTFLSSTGLSPTIKVHSFLIDQQPDIQKACIIHWSVAANKAHKNVYFCEKVFDFHQQVGCLWRLWAQLCILLTSHHDATCLQQNTSIGTTNTDGPSGGCSLV